MSEGGTPGGVNWLTLPIFADISSSRCESAPSFLESERTHVRCYGFQRSGVECTCLRESVYTPYNVDYQQLKCLQNSLHFFQSIYIVDYQRSKCLHSILKNERDFNLSH
jgi:hypothetical protein